MSKKRSPGFSGKNRGVTPSVFARVSSTLVMPLFFMTALLSGFHETDPADRQPGGMYSNWNLFTDPSQERSMSSVEIAPVEMPSAWQSAQSLERALRKTWTGTSTERWPSQPRMPPNDKYCTLYTVYRKKWYICFFPCFSQFLDKFYETFKQWRKRLAACARRTPRAYALKQNSELINSLQQYSS